jgi:colanic acid/amylovoran biosynthesis glycosyltransferase
VPCRFAYLFERFPAFTQTFCAREIVALYKRHVCPEVFSLKTPIEAKPQNIPGLDQIPIHYLPDTNNLLFKIETKIVTRRLLPKWSGSGDTREKNQFYEAAYLGKRLQKLKIQHVHTHFAGLAAKTAWWLRELYGITYSFTGHANDIFIPRPDQRTDLKHLIADAQFVVTVSDHGAAHLKSIAPEAANKIKRIYNGLDITLFKPAKPERHPVKILSVGRLIEKKGFPILIEACKLLQDQSIEFQCTIIGAGPDESQLRSLIDRLHLADQVFLPGPKSQPEIVEALANSELFVLPAIQDRNGDADNLPTVLIEAMASGLPVIGTDVAGIPEIVLNGKNGWIVPQKDANLLAKSIRELVAAPDLRKQFGRESLALAQSTFSINSTIKQLIKQFKPWI